MKRVISVALCLVLALSCLTGCGLFAPKDPLVGEWKLDMSFVDVLKSTDNSLDDTFKNFKTDTKLDFIKISFNEDGTSKMTVSADDAKNCVTTLMNDMTKYLEDGGMYDLLGAAYNNATKEEIDALLHSSGKTMEEIIKEYKEQLNTDDLFENLTSSMAQSLGFSGSDIKNGDISKDYKYKVKDDKIYMAETEEELAKNNTADAAEFSLSDNKNTLTITLNDVDLNFARS